MMKLYCRVLDGVVVEEPRPLPPSAQSLSDFELLMQGWYYAECIRPETFSDRYEVFLPIQYDIQSYKVICTFTKRNKTTEELATQNAEKQLQVEADKTDRLANASSFMQTPEYAKLSERLQTDWVEYVQQVTNTVTTDLGDAIWDVGFPSQPLTSEKSVFPVIPNVV